MERGAYPSGCGRLLKQGRSLDKIDLLFAIDNSPSMADKQAILADAVPDLVDRLTNPLCVDANGANPERVDPGQLCPTGKAREFLPIKDIHVGVITSSLGGHGADSCSTSSPTYNPHQQDMSHLLTRGKADGDTSLHDVGTWDHKGFLNWDPDGKDIPSGQNNATTLAADFGDIVRGAGDDGCGFPSTLEAWYRFLVDPAPYQQLIPCPCFDGGPADQCRCPEGVDNTVLQQRADMIRQDSMLVIVMLSDRNDCSVVDGKDYYLALQAGDSTNPFHIVRGTNACQSDPWSPACKSCLHADASTYPECATGWPDPATDDPMSLRCFEQQRRFGTNFLQPIQRYVDGLSQQTFSDNTINPVFCSQFGTRPDGTVDRTTCASTIPLRDRSLVYLVGIVGVPWQDVAVDPNDLSKGYRTASDLTTPMAELSNAPIGVPADQTLWDVILGQTRDSDGEIVPTVDPLDPLMKESIDPRTGTNPITGDVLAPTASGPLNNKINGSDRDIVARDDLQYACIFDLPMPIPNGSDCPPGNENPLCYDGSTFGTTQYRAKAYPGRRQLAVLKGVGDQGIVASICPAKINPVQSSDTDWGYRPAIESIVDRLTGSLQPSCWDVPLAADASGRVPCVVLEATKSDEVDSNGDVVCPPCEGARTAPSPATASVVTAESSFLYDGLSCLCELRQLSDPEQLRSCIQDTAPDPGLEGWCYLDAGEPLASEALLAHCPADDKRLIRFLGSDVPADGSVLFLVCNGAVVAYP